MGVFLLFLAAVTASYFVGRTAGRKTARVDSMGRPLPPPAQIYEEGYRAGYASAAGHTGAAVQPPGPAVPPPGPVLPHPGPVVPHPGSPAPQAGSPAPQQGMPGTAPAMPPRTAAATPQTGAMPAAGPAAAQAPSPAAPSPAVSLPAASASAHAAPVQPAGQVPPAPGMPGRHLPAASGNRPAPKPAPPVKTEAELREEKRRRDLRNINITLYSASLLLVAAAALFIGLAIPEQARFLGVVVVTALFYVSGLVIHARSRRLKPAAVAFTGTGLALIPVVGLALYTLVLTDGPAAWLVTSAAGTAAFAYAAAKLESRVVTYLALTFLLSSGLASGAALRWGIVWYFLFTVILATLISLAAVRRPRWLNNLYVDAFVRSHRFLVPATAIASVRVSGDLGAAQLAVLFLGFAAYYAVMLWQGPARHMLANSYGLRAAGTVGLTALFYSFTGSSQATLLAFAVQVAAQTAGVLIQRPVYGTAGLLQAASKVTGLPLDGDGEGRDDGGRRPATPAPPGGQAPPAGTVSLGKEPARTAGPSVRALFRADVAALLVLQAGTGLVAGLGSAHGLWENNTAVYAATAFAVLLTFLAAAWKLGGAVEFTVVVPLGLALVPPAAAPDQSLWPAVLVTAALTVYLSVRAAATGPVQRPIFILAARAAAIALVPQVPLALGPGVPGGSPGDLALIGTVGALAVNQMVSAVRLHRGKHEFLPGPSVCIAAAGAALLVLGLRVHDAQGLTLAGLWIVVAANILTSLLQSRGPYLAAGPAGFAVAALIGAGILGVRGYELLAASALGYCVVLALRSVSGPQRACWIAAGQGALTVLTALVVADLGAGVHGIFIGMAVCLSAQYLARLLLDVRLAALSRIFTWATLAVLGVLPPLYYILTYTAARPVTGVVLLLICAGTAAVGQCTYAMASARKQAFDTPEGVPAAAPALPASAISAVGAAAAVLLFSTGVRTAEDPAGVATATVLAGALAVNVLTALLLRRGWPVLLAPAGFAAAALVGAGVLGLRGYEALVAAALAYCAGMVPARSTMFRAAYLLAAQTLTVVLAGLVAADITGDTQLVFVALSVTVGLLHVLRTLGARRIEPLGLAETGRWGGLAAAAGVPFAYTVLTRDDADETILMFLIASTVAVALFTQLAAVLRLRRRRPLPHGLELVVAAFLTAVVAAAASRAVEGQAAWSLALLWTVLAASVATSLLLPDRFEPAAVAGFAAAAALGAGLLGLHGYELLVLAGIAYAVRTALRREQSNRGLYVLAVQGLLVLLAVLAAADLGANVHGLFTAGAVALAVQHLVRTGLHRRIDAAGYSETSLWLSLALLALAPVFYVLHTTVEARRGAVALELFLLLAAAVVAYVRRRAAAEARTEWILYPAVAALGALPVVLSGLPDFAAAGLLPEPALTADAAGLILLVLAVAALCGESRCTWAASTRTPLLSAAAGYTAMLLVTASATGSMYLLSAGFALAGAVFLVVSHTRTLSGASGAWLVLGVPPFIAAGAVCLVAGLSRSVLSGAADAGCRFLLSAWVAALLLLLLRAVRPQALRPGSPAEGQPAAGTGPDAGAAAALRSRVLGSASVLGLLLAAVPAMAPDSTAVAGSLTLVTALALTLPELPGRWREPAAQIGSLLTALAVQRMAWLVLGGVDGFWSVQYWACVLAGLAGYEFLRKREARGTAVLAAAAVVLSASGLYTVISGGGGRQLWALVAHAGLLAFGLLASRRLFTIWGAAGVVLAVLWYLRGYTFLLLALLGVGLIALAVWRLTRVRSEPDGSDGSRSPQTGPQPGPPSRPRGGSSIPAPAAPRPNPAAPRPNPAAQAPAAIPGPPGPPSPQSMQGAQATAPPAPPAPPVPPAQGAGGGRPDPGEPWVRP